MYMRSCSLLHEMLSCGKDRRGAHTSLTRSIATTVYVIQCVAKALSMTEKSKLVRPVYLREPCVSRVVTLPRHMTISLAAKGSGDLCRLNEANHWANQYCRVSGTMIL